LPASNSCVSACFASIFESLRGQLPEFDETTGMMKASGHEMTPLGRMLLREIGLAKPGEF
jgi:hypothetical protein